MADFSLARYNPPGVYTEPIPGPQLAVNSTAPTAVGLFGLTVGYQTFTESLLINPDEDVDTPAVNRTLAQQGINTATIEVRNPNSGTVWVENTDYTVVRISAGPDAVTATRDDTYTISRVIDGGHIDPGDVVQISYRYTNPDYFKPQLFFDYDDLRDMYGQPFDSQGNVQSELTLASRFAFLNGAYQIVAVAVDPADPNNVIAGDYFNALEKLEDNPLIAVIVPANGQQPLFQLVQEHIYAQSHSRFERRAILGRDGVANPVSYNQRIIDAQALTDQRIAMVAPSAFKYFSPELNKVINLGAQYMAACLAGWTVSHNPAMPLTRKVVAGWTDTYEFEPEGQKNLESQNGLMVVEKSRRQLIQVRHGVTTDPSDLVHREWSIIGQQDSMVFRLRDYLENDDLIGQPIYDITLINVKASAESALQSLIRDAIIRDYTGLKVRQLITNPDVIEVAFGWLPAFPLNYILVRFAVTLSTGDITSTAGVPNSSNVTSASQVSALLAPNPGLSFNDGNTLSSA